MFVVVLFDDSKNIVDVTGPFDTIKLAADWVVQQNACNIVPVNFHLEIEHVSNP